MAGAWQGFTDRPAFSNARDIAEDIASQYIDGKVDRVEIDLQPLRLAADPERAHRRRCCRSQADRAQLVAEAEEEGDDDEEAADEERRPTRALLWIYEPDPEEILQRLVPDYIEITIYRALLESTASEHGARMTAMRNAQENAGDMIDDLTLEMNRQRQAEITQEIMEVVAGAEGLT